MLICQYDILLTYSLEVKMEITTVRKNIILKSNVNEKLVKESERVGVSQSNLISFALDAYFRTIEKDSKNKSRKTK